MGGIRNNLTILLWLSTAMHMFYNDLSVWIILNFIKLITGGFQ